MQGTAWIAVLRRIPAALHDCIMLVTTAGDVMVQNLVRFERDYLVVRGRMAGSTDTGRVLFIPFDQISYAGLTRALDDAELQQLLGKPGAAVQPVENGAAFELGPAVTVPSTVEQPTPAAAEPPKPNHPSKSILLARLRARLANEQAKAP
jgi:hypothetical protein